jgi:lipopolysaccharide export LptBFGC system permease protein LptF
MSNNPNPIRTGLSRGSIFGFVLGVLAIILFVVLWLGLGSLNVSQFPRLMVSVCLPPAIIAALIGVYMLFWRPRA